MGLVDTKEDPTVELIKKELARAITIRRAVRQRQPNVEALNDQPQIVTDPGASSGGVASGVVDDGGSHPDVAAATSQDYEHIGAQQKIMNNVQTWQTQELNASERNRLRWVQQKYMIYNYCTDAKRFSQGFSPECKRSRF
ncbi:hypothetical protein P3L10_021662 [Capsicum annuum]